MHVKPQPNTCDSWWEILCFGQCSIWAFHVICLNLPYAACCFFCNELIWSISHTEKNWKIFSELAGRLWVFWSLKRDPWKPLVPVGIFEKTWHIFLGYRPLKKQIHKVPVQHGSDCLLVCSFLIINAVPLTGSIQDGSTKHGLLIGGAN